MDRTDTWNLANVDTLKVSDPEFFAHPHLSFEQRCSLVEGEMVKIAIYRNENTSLKLARRWVIVDQVKDSKPPKFIGHVYNGTYPKPPFDNEVIEFGPESVYRTEPRQFKLWGKHGVPVSIRGCDSIPEVDEKRIANTAEIVSQFTANGWAEAKEKYFQLQDAHDNWPDFNELK